jgi:hypothetical protein
MRRQTGRVAAAVLFSVLASSSFGQVVGAVQSTALRTGVTAPGCSENGQAGPPIQRQPYTAELKTTSVQVLANGTTITRESTEIRAVDSQQRTFSSTTGNQFSADQPPFMWANVNDPVENTQINWDSQSKKARVVKMPPQADRHGCWATDSGNMRMNYGPETPADVEAAKQQMKAMIAERVKARAASGRNSSEPKMEDLGTTTIEGVEAQGHRWTMVIPVGQIGNDRELVQTNESWFAPSLGFEVRRINDDPRSGKSTTEVTHLDLSEPPLATFQPPEGYEVTVEEMHQVPCDENQGFGGSVGAQHLLTH